MSTINTKREAFAKLRENLEKYLENELKIPHVSSQSSMYDNETAVIYLRARFGGRSVDEVQKELMDEYNIEEDKLDLTDEQKHKLRRFAEAILQTLE